MKHEYDLRAEKEILAHLEGTENWIRYFTVYCEKEKAEVTDLFIEMRSRLLEIFTKHKDGDAL